MADTGVNTRELIVTMLQSINKGEEYSHILIRNVLDKYDYLDVKDKAFIKCVTEGCVERQIELDYIINCFSKTSVAKMKPFIRELVRMSTYQIMFMDKVPDSAAINEAVKLAKKKGFSGLSGFVNGVLRSISRGKADIKYPDSKKDRLNYRSVHYSMPLWIIEEFDKLFGEEAADRVMESFLAPRPVVIRFSEKTENGRRESLIREMEDSGVIVTPHPYNESAFTLKNLNGVLNLPGFSEGAFTVQDVSSMTAVMAAGIKPGDFVMDVCAAPGGKSIYAAELAGESGKVLARDLTAYKTDMIKAAADRMKVTNLEIEEWDATTLDERYVGKADVVIADLPCLGLGVIGRKRDIKFKTSKEQIAEIALLQKQILKTVSSYVKKGGTLLYSTCSMTDMENFQNCRWIEEELGFKGVDITNNLTEGLTRDITNNQGLLDAKAGRLQLAPGLYDCDGFFLSRFVRE